MDFLSTTYLGNTVRAWIVALVLAQATFLFLRLIAVKAVGRLGRTAAATRNHWDDVIASALGATKSPLLLLIAAFVGANTLAMPGRWAGLLRSMTIIALLFQAGFWLSAGLTKWVAARADVLAADRPGEVMTMAIVGVTTKLVLWSMVVLLALDNMGVDVTALVAGLGIGGVAVALAAQNILGDLFASLSIVLDKPFVLGDFLVVGDFLGSVEAIGLKTTRVRSLSGEQVVFSNNDLLTSRIRNYGRMYERRVLFKIGVTYQTPRDRLREIPGLIREAIEAEGDETVRFDRAHMASYGDYALVFEVVYYLLSPNYNVHMDAQQEVFFRIHEAFEEREIEFAYPTQTLIVERSGE
jgi:small-conductance mechanosensitive channel